MSDTPSGFVAGLSSRHDLAANALAQAFAPRSGFVEAIPVMTPFSFSSPAARESTATHFSPADKTANPTRGWDPLRCDPGTNAFLDPLTEAHAAGFAEGMAAAAAEMQLSADRDRELIDQLAQGLSSCGHIDRESFAERLRVTVLNLASRIVGEIGIEPDVLAGRIAAATDCLADASESAMLRVHPGDVALLDGRLPRTVFAVGDPHVARGSFVLESASTVVEEGPETWLAQLASAIDKVPAPRC
jgi:flagellar assembly protein FliH